MRGPPPNHNSSYQSRRDNLNEPPSASVLVPKHHQSEFSVLEHNVSKTQKNRLSVEFPTQPKDSNPNDISMYFKKLMTILFAVDKKMVLLNWDNPSQNPITKAIDIQPSKEEISHYFSGMRVLSNSKKISWFVKIESEQPFWITKQDDRLFSWLQKNRVFIRQTTLSQNRHANIGWLLYSHPEYTSQTLAASDLRSRMSTRKLEFELVPHNIVHITSSDKKIRTRALKVRSNFNDKDKVYKELMECLSKGTNDPKLSLMSNTGEFKFIPFGNKIFTNAQITRLMKKQNHFLHNTHGVSVVNLNLIDGVFEEKHKLLNKKKYNSRKRKAESFFEKHSTKNQNKNNEYEKMNDVDMEVDGENIYYDDNDEKSDDEVEVEKGEDRVNSGDDDNSRKSGEGWGYDDEELGEGKLEMENDRDGDEIEDDEDEKSNNNGREEEEVCQDSDFPNDDWNENNFTTMQILKGASFEGKKIFSTLEPGRKNHFYFLTTKQLASEAEKYIDWMFDHQLQTFGKKWCLRVYGMRKDDELPRRESRFLVNKTIRDYINNLGIDDESDWDQSEAPPQTGRLKKKRALIEFGNQKHSAWNTPLFGENNTTQEATSKHFPPIDGTSTTDTSTTVNTSITDWSKDIAFLQADFNKAIQLENVKRQEEREKIGTRQKRGHASDGRAKSLCQSHG